jgi:hypothetical protein
MNNSHEIRILPPFNSVPDAATVSNVTAGTTNTGVVTPSGVVIKLRGSFPVSDRDALDAIADQQVEGLIEIFPQLSEEAKRQIVSKLQSSLWGDSHCENRNVQEGMSLGSISDIEQQVQLMRTKPQKGTKYLQMVGMIEERISPEND